MTDDHQALLESLERNSRVRQEMFLDAIAVRLNRPRAAKPPDHPFRGAPDFWQSQKWPPEERIRRFIHQFQLSGGMAERLDTMESARDLIASRASAMGLRHIVCQDQQELAELGLKDAIPEARISVWNSRKEEDWIAIAAEADGGVVLADYAAAVTGTAVVMSDRGKGRSVSLLPGVLFIIIPATRMKTRLGEIFAEIERMGPGGLPAGIHFISGPSRSADIENDLTIGVHGPGMVHALIIG